ncbi:hypothetical protein [Rhodococcoides corynebacterioides]|uniref:Mce-associated membrane protein n=1 Tax=Rhodococcoides corynebacterioides TaxID=53972 RepID=A0ABS7P447_9NOCA|nr:hypothetical protein [Rhodococcus corynebacterioides]MBY6367185.1 hypothetical protein [Rhodococcus corynebacterioides]MBY6407401.1 hypothetical protein [Rhodococcus corynebacterioides]
MSTELDKNHTDSGRPESDLDEFDFVDQGATTTTGTAATDAPAASDAPADGNADRGGTARSGRRTTVLLAVVAVLAVLAAGLAVWQWRSAAGALDAERAADADRAAAVDVARGYTERSLTYDHTNIDGFFAGVEEGTTDALRERFDGVREVLTQIMTDSQVVASGAVNAATVTAQDGGVYTVKVFATQTTQNLQQPEPGAVPTLLTVTVEKDGDRWLVSDYGADTGAA